MSDGLLPVFPAVFLVLFAAMWCAILFLIAVLGGWRRLSVVYCAPGAPEGAAYLWQHGRVGMASYRSSLNIHVAPQGLFLSTPLLFRVAHPTLFIPWGDIDVIATRQVLWRRTAEIAIGRPPLARLTLPERVLRDDSAPPAVRARLGSS